MKIGLVVSYLVLFGWVAAVQLLIASGLSRGQQLAAMVAVTVCCSALWIVCEIYDRRRARD